MHKKVGKWMWREIEKNNLKKEYNKKEMWMEIGKLVIEDGDRGD